MSEHIVSVRAVSDGWFRYSTTVSGVKFSASSEAPPDSGSLRRFVRLAVHCVVLRSVFLAHVEAHDSWVSLQSMRARALRSVFEFTKMSLRKWVKARARQAATGRDDAVHIRGEDFAGGLVCAVPTDSDARRHDLRNRSHHEQEKALTNALS